MKSINFKFLLIIVTTLISCCVNNSDENDSKMAAIVIGLSSDVGGFNGFVSTTYYITAQFINSGIKTTQVISAEEASKYRSGDTIFLPLK